MSEMAGGPLWRGWAVALAFALLRRRFPGVDALEDSEGQGLSGGGGAVCVPSESLGPRKGCSWLTPGPCPVSLTQSPSVLLLLRHSAFPQKQRQSPTLCKQASHAPWTWCPASSRPAGGSWTRLPRGACEGLCAHGWSGRGARVGSGPGSNPILSAGLGLGLKLLRSVLHHLHPFLWYPGDRHFPQLHQVPAAWP